MGPFFACPPPQKKLREISRSAKARKARSAKPTGAQSARSARSDNQDKSSAEAAGDVGLRARITGSGEELRRGAELDELPNEQERREVADARGLLHIVGDDSDGADVFQLHQQFFNFGSADGIERGAGFIEEENFGFDGKSAGNAQALLLAAGELVRRLVEMVFDGQQQRLCIARA